MIPLAATLSIHSFISPVIAGMGILAGLVCTFLLVWSGIQYITSGGNVAKMMSAKHSIFRALLGLVIVLGAAMLSFILNHNLGPSVTHSTQHLPALNSIKVSNGSGGLVDVIINAISGLLVVIIRSAVSPFIDALKYFTSGTPLMANNSTVMHLWVVATGVADALFALVLALIGFHVMSAEQFGLRDINLKSLVPQILLTFVLINTSIYLLDGIIELSNAMIVAMRAGSGNITPWQSLLSLVSSFSGYSLAALFIFVIFLVFTVILLIYYISRLVVLYLGAILAPLVILLWLLPGFRDFAENALKTYISTVFVLFIHVIILTLAGSLFLEVGTNNGSKDPIMSLLLGLATLVALLKTQGVLMQLNYASIGPKTARRLGGSFINGVSYIGSTAKYTFAEITAPLSGIGSTVKNMMPETTRTIKVKGRRE